MRRVAQRVYSHRAHFYRTRVRGWHDDERLHLTRAWLNGLKTTTLACIVDDMIIYRLCWHTLANLRKQGRLRSLGQVREPRKPYPKR